MTTGEHGQRSDVSEAKRRRGTLYRVAYIDNADRGRNPYELLRGCVTPRSRKSGVYKVLMPKGLATKLDAERASGEGMSEAILRLAGEAMEPSKQDAPL
jgi:hypothetical protein